MHDLKDMLTNNFAILVSSTKKTGQPGEVVEMADNVRKIAHIYPRVA